MSMSPAERIALLPEPERRRFLSMLTAAEQERLEYDWSFWARPEQLPPGGRWRTWLMRSGRGFGKTKSGSQWVRSQIESGRRRRIAIVGATEGDVRKYQVEGPSGIMSVCPPDFRPIFEPSNNRLVWPNGAEAHTMSADKPEAFRGPNFDGAWNDELCSWGNASNKIATETYKLLQLCLRIPGPMGDPAQELITTTPKPMPLLREIMGKASTVVTGGSIFDNAANLDADTLKYYCDEYLGTSLGRQELFGEVLDAFEGALWSPKVLDDNRRGPAQGWGLVVGMGKTYLMGPDMGAGERQHIFFKRIVVAVDPSGSGGRKSNETGIVVCALGTDDHGYVLEDLSGIMSPESWAKASIGALAKWDADYIVAEQNFGAEMVRATIRAADRDAPVKLVVASRGKAVRAQPVSLLDQQGRIHHVGIFPKLEDQMVTWNPVGNDESPDRMDARVWGFSELMVRRRVDLMAMQGAGPSVIPIYAR